jgi:hypothetical protein
VFRALGHAEPPTSVELDAETFRHVETLKHDSWAVTAVYRSATRTAKCKFNRTQPILFMPMSWLGRLLAARERWFMKRLAGIQGIPVSLGEVRVEGQRLTLKEIGGVLGLTRERVRQIESETLASLAVEIEAAPKATLRMRRGA